MKLLFPAAIFAALMLFSIAGQGLPGQVVIDNNLVVLLTEDFTGGVGNGPGQVRWEGSGGFAAVGGDRTVQIGAPETTIFWAEPNFIGNGNTLILGDPNADGTLIWDKAINLGFANRTIRVLHGSGNTTRADARLDRELRGGNITFEGDGRLDMTVDNPQLVREVFIYGAELRLNMNGRLSNTSQMLVSMGGSFVIDNSGKSNATTGGQYHSDRFNDTAKRIILTAGTLRYIGQEGASDSIETLSTIALIGGSNIIDIINNSQGFSTEVRIGHLQKLTANATLNFISSSGISNFGVGARLRSEQLFDSAEGGMLPYATVNGEDWAAVNTVSANDHRIISYFDYTDAQANWNISSNASPTTNQVLSADRVLNSLRLTGGRQVDLSGWKLTLNAGALLSTGGANTTISGGTLSLSPDRDNYVHVYNTGATGLTISSTIRGPYAFTKTGPGSLTFSGTTANSLSYVYVNEGMLILNKSAGVAAIGNPPTGRLVIGDRGHTVIVRLDNNEQIHNPSEVWLRGGFADEARHVRHEAILQFNGAGGAGLTEIFRVLQVEGRGVIDFQGGTLATPNFLILDDLWVRSEVAGGSVLLVRHWMDFEDRLLVRRSSANLAASLPYIHFEGYELGAVTRDYNATFFEVIPMNLPEPSTYGAIFGAIGFVLWLRRTRKVRRLRS